jgi:PE family
MAYVIASPEMMASAATDLATIGSNVSAAQMAAAARTVAVLPAAADEVSASIAHLFSQHAQGYQAQAAQAAAFNDQFST